MIFLLAGHGGGDSGAVGVNGRTESAGACKQILRWDKQKWRVLRGLTRRRNAEYKLCVGG